MPMRNNKGKDTGLGDTPNRTQYFCINTYAKQPSFNKSSKTVLVR